MIYSEDSLTPEEHVDSLVDMYKIDETPRSMVAENDRLVAALVYALDKIEARELHISLKKLYLTHLSETFHGPKSYDTIKTYITKVLKRSYRTGKAL